MAEFLAEHWEQRPLVVARGEEGRYDDLLSVADVERLVCSSGIRTPGFRLVKEGEKLDPRDYSVDLPWRPRPFTGTADVARVLAEFERGATIVLQGLHLFWEPLARFCRDLERELAPHPAQANAYFTPRGSQGLAVHHDTHDVLVLQVAGEKRWRVYEPAFELPLRSQRYRPEMGAPGEAVEDVVLRPGDTLYLPRGWLHEAMTSAADSLHITVGVNVATWLDAFRAALAECADDPGFRRSVSGDGEGADELLERLGERLAPERVAERARQRFVASRRPLLAGQLRELRALDRLGPETELERRPTVVFDLADGGLAFEGKEISFPAHVRAELAFIAEADGPFRAVDLPGELDPESRLVLLRRLVREGFLVTSASGGAAPSPRSDGRAGA